MSEMKSILPRRHLDIRFRPPGSKSITNRALVCAALAPGRSRLFGALLSDDTEAMVGCLGALGVSVDRGDGVWLVDGGHLGESRTPLDARLSGTTLRFVTAALTVATGTSIIDGGARLRERPIGELVAALADLGAHVVPMGASGGAPLEVAGPRLIGGRVVVDARRSSQPVSAIMMVAPYAAQDVVIECVGEVASASYLETTREVMAGFGVDVDLGPPIHIPAGNAYRPVDFVIEPDASAAVYGWVAAAMTGGTAQVEGIRASSTQSDLGVLGVLQQMGARVERAGDSITVVGPERLDGTVADMSDCPDGALAVAVAAATAGTPTTLTGLSTLSVKETDRLAALETELRRIGARAEATADRLTIEPARLHGAVIETYDDHRMAMAFSLAGLVVDGISIRDPDCVRKTWPEYWKEFDSWA